jgi:hypothetical protein
MIKVILITIVLSTGTTTEVEFSNMESCLKHKGQIESQKGLESMCIYQEVKKKSEIDYFAERIGRNLMVLVNAKLTQLLHEEIRK